MSAKRIIGEFPNYQPTGPVSTVRPTGAGKGAVIAILTDPNYKSVPPGILEIRVKAPLELEPENLVLLQHGKVHIKVFKYLYEIYSCKYYKNVDLQHVRLTRFKIR